MSNALPAAISQTIEVMPSLAELEASTLEKLGHHARLINAETGDVLFRPGSACENFLIVLNGTVRTSITGETGREIVLYRVDVGQTCVLTTSCLMSHSNYDTEGIAETDVTALTIPRPIFLELLGTSEKFRNLAFETFSERLHDLIILINEISFGHLDTRLASYLSQKAVDGTLKATHQTIAQDLGSAREAVSRLLKEFEHKGLVKLERGQIMIINGGQLTAYNK